MLNSRGRVPVGVTCKFSDRCLCKEPVCNGNGCPVSNGKTHSFEFSCATARMFDRGWWRRENNALKGRPISLKNFRKENK